MQLLCDQGISKDISTFQKLFESLWNNETAFPTLLGLKKSLSERTIDEREIFCFRKQVWVPDWEPLKIALIQKSHDSHATGHPG